jgi:hypothetical protein
MIKMKKERISRPRSDLLYMIKKKKLQNVEIGDCTGPEVGPLIKFNFFFFFFYIVT